MDCYATGWWLTIYTEQVGPWRLGGTTEIAVQQRCTGGGSRNNQDRMHDSVQGPGIGRNSPNQHGMAPRTGPMATKLVRPRFGAVVHRTPTEDILVQENKQGSIDKIIEENDLAEKGYKIEDVAWLKRKDKPLGRSASLGIWFDIAEAAKCRGIAEMSLSSQARIA
jgi:hypothetical protein